MKAQVEAAVGQCSLADLRPLAPPRPTPAAGFGELSLGSASSENGGARAAAEAAPAAKNAAAGKEGAKEAAQPAQEEAEAEAAATPAAAAAPAGGAEWAAF